MKKASILLAFAAIFLVGLVLASPTGAKSTNQCSSCHQSQYYQYLSLEGKSIPTSVRVGDTATVTLSINNLSNALTNNMLNSITLQITPMYGKLSVSTPKISLSQLPVGSKTVSIDVKGLAVGTDALMVMAQASNQHRSVSLSDVLQTSVIDVVSAPPPPPPTYNTAITVVDKVSSKPLQGATISLGVTSKLTDAKGVASFSTVEGNYTLEISNPGYSPTLETINVRANATLTRSLSEIPKKPTFYIVKISVVDENNSTGIGSVQVSLDGVGSLTDSHGVTTRSTSNGTHIIKAEKAGYTTTTKGIDVEANTALTIPLVLEAPIPAKPRLYNVTICVSRHPSTLLPGANVQLGNQSKTTDALGKAYFEVKNGTYALTIEKDGFESANNSLSVSSDSVIYSTLNEKAVVITPPQPAASLPGSVSEMVFPATAMSYILLFLYAVYVSTQRTAGHPAFLGYSAWALSLSTLLIYLLQGRLAEGEYYRLSPLGLIALTTFSLISIGLAMGTWRRRAYAIGATLAASTMMVYSLLGILPVAILSSMLCIPFIWNEYRHRSTNGQIRSLRYTLIKTNRAVSWIFVAFTIAAMLSGYALTRLGMFTTQTYAIHTALGYGFGALLVTHIVLSVASKYPWVNVLKGVGKLRSHPWSFVKAFQVISAIGLVAFGLVQFFTGLGYLDANVAAILPLRMHLDVGGLLLAVFFLHAGIGVKAVAMRSRVSFPGLNHIIASATATLILTAIFLTMIKF